MDIVQKIANVSIAEIIFQIEKLGKNVLRNLKQNIQKFLIKIKK